MQKPQEFTAIFEDKQVYNDKFTHLHFELKNPHRMEFEAGQFVTIDLQDEDNTKRAYSIASDPDIKHGFELLLDVSPQGKGVTYLQNLEFGQEVKLMAPMGRFIIADEENGEEAIALVGTGSGIAPLRSMALDLLKNKEDQREIILYWGLRFENQMVWEDDFSMLMENYPNFKFHPVLSRAGEAWPLCRGHVTDCLSVHEQQPNTGYYLCGGKAMVNDCKKLLKEAGVDRKKIHHEKFY